MTSSIKRTRVLSAELLRPCRSVGSARRTTSCPIESLVPFGSEMNSSVSWGSSVIGRCPSCGRPSHGKLRRFRSCSSRAVFFEYLSVSVSRPTAPRHPVYRPFQNPCVVFEATRMQRHVSSCVNDGHVVSDAFWRRGVDMTALKRYCLNCEEIVLL